MTAENSSEALPLLVRLERTRAGTIGHVTLFGFVASPLALDDDAFRRMREGIAGMARVGSVSVPDDDSAWTPGHFLARARILGNTLRYRVVFNDHVGPHVLLGGEAPQLGELVAHFEQVLDVVRVAELGARARRRVSE